jgi:hypothetical protein
MIRFLAGVQDNLMLMLVDAGCYRRTQSKRWQELLSGLPDVTASPVFIQMRRVGCRPRLRVRLLRNMFRPQVYRTLHAVRHHVSFVRCNV